MGIIYGYGAGAGESLLWRLSDMMYEELCAWVLCELQASTLYGSSYAVL